MALSFLNDIGPSLNLLAGVLARKQAVGAVKNNNVATKSEKQTNDLYQSLLDPNNPIMQRLVASNQAQNLANFQQQITEMQLADRRAQALGRAPTFFAPERADEAVSYLTSRGIPQLNALAQQQAQQRISGAASGISNNIDTERARQNINMQTGVSNAAYRSQLPQQILDIIQGLSPNQKRY